MIRGLYTATAGMLATQTQSEIIGDNVANVRTPGYKQEDGILKAFPDMLIERTALTNGMSENTLIGSMGTGVVVDSVARMNVQGALQTTDLPTDLAFASPGFFTVQTPEGERYTRNGRFQINAEGTLQNADGFPVLGEKGPIGPLSSAFTVSTNGTVSDQGQVIDRLRMVRIPEETLIREGQSLYSSSQPAQIQNAEMGTVQIRQGAIEGSNVDISGQMTKMITVMNAYQANQKVIQTTDSTLEKAVNEVGKV
ncbi:flagellar hook-basal body protein [Desulfitobacterium metallireducens]|uniref:Flagellar basal body rod protein FlgG n=1 Tax=Desulfitobacterium metallireducens DSM 15288 TaxID=871968 RepID=W0EAI5_9FIRM|nr:flagellar hook-basal body protein [Desulfitobacterium metallireducens]AHF07762.1 flagellar basal body rod protein FlgG [Desulfitobacterium metallireducens DSM 15288]